MLQGVSLKQLKADISRNLDITQGPVLVLQKVDPKTTYHVVKPVSQWPDTAQAWETVQHWAWVSFFRQETVSQLTAPQTSTHLPRSTYDGEGRSPSTLQRALQAYLSPPQRVWDPLPLRMSQKP